MRNSNFVFLASFALPLFAGCAVSADAEEQADDRVIGQAVTASDNSTYYSVRRDLRKCGGPRCGGFWVSRVNLTTTKCADGSRQAACYVAQIDFAGVGLSNEEASEFRSRRGNLLVRGDIVARDYPGAGNLGVFEATEAWAGHAGPKPTGIFYRLQDNGIRCRVAPCPSTKRSKLNSNNRPRDVAGFDLSAVPGDPDAAFEQYNEPAGLLVAGTNSYVGGPFSKMVQVVASEFYVPVRPAQTSQACGSRGMLPCPEGTFCNFPVSASCGRADAPGVCAPIKHACTREYAPVCGCDGRDYSNACEAARHGVSIDYQGRCKDTSASCGGIEGLGCAAREFCETPIGQCEVADAMGSCRAKPRVCLANHEPVCGCNGKTYSNACAAASAGVSLDHDGACK